MPMGVRPRLKLKLKLALVMRSLSLARLRSNRISSMAKAPGVDPELNPTSEIICNARTLQALPTYKASLMGSQQAGSPLVTKQSRVR
ncbi:hypothetical protein TWF106_007822 [Orbilia oligospora]|uniref:Uncharacterized protein n=1 Tax=Orbilia oligospora TaxID=2813651 RepID=A0A7C8UZW2_ORBOL|nr:hypothetical protein TWF106_007822 [Orbilia oligospora]